jgi:hypothetical protein
LPGIAGTFDEFNFVRHVYHGDTEARRKSLLFIEPFLLCHPLPALRH